MRKIILFAEFFVIIFFGYSQEIFAITPLPYNSIEEAVRASGGTYGVIDTKDPDSSSNFVQTVFDQGLTGSDGNGECTSMNIRSGIEISCALSVNGNANYYYKGKKGEKVKITVVSKTFDAEVYVRDANKEFILAEKNYDAKNPIETSITLPYTGQYVIEIQAKGGKYGNFTIKVSSETGGIQPDIRKDTLVEGKKYSVYELHRNQSKIGRTFSVGAYVIEVYKEPNCPKDAFSCPMSVTPNITIGDSCALSNLENACKGKKSDARLWLGTSMKYDFVIGKQYQFNVAVRNTSSTNVPENVFTLVSAKELKGEDVTTSSSSHVEGALISVKELKNLKFITASSTFDVVGYALTDSKCDPNKGMNCPPPRLLISDTNDVSDTENMIEAVHPKSGFTEFKGGLNNGKKYFFTMTVNADCGEILTCAKYHLKSIKEISNNTQKPKVSFLSKFVEWFLGFLRKDEQRRIEK